MYSQEQDVMKLVKPGQRVFIHGGAATPHHLLNLLADQADQLWNVELVSVSLQGNSILTDKRYRNSFRMNSLFVSENVREAVNDGRGDYVPIFLSEIPLLFKKNILPWMSR